MFNDVTVNPGVGSGLNRDSKLPKLLFDLANKRKQDKSVTSDVQAAFKEGERSPIREAAAA